MLGGYFSATGSPELHKIDGLLRTWALVTPAAVIVSDFPLSTAYLKTEAVTSMCWNM